MADTADPYATRLSLLHRLRDSPGDQGAWSEFVERYGTVMRQWCRQWGLQDADAEDVTQNVMLDLARQMKEFEYDTTGKFRSWLKTVAYRAWYDYAVRRRHREQGTGESEILRVLESAEARDDCLQELQAEADRELVAIASERVRQRVQPSTWEAFRLMSIEQISGAETAARLGMKPGAVYVANSKVKQLLHEEVERLDCT